MNKRADFPVRDEEETLAQQDEERRRLVRVESKLTNIMTYFGINYREDIKAERANHVIVADNDVHALSPDVKVTWLYDAMLDAGLKTADLYVAGVYRGQIVLDKRG